MSKWANEQIAHFSLLLTKNEQFAQNNSNFFISFLQFFLKIFKKQKICSFLLSEVSESVRSLRTNERLWAIAQIAQKEWVIVSKLLRSLTKNERIAHSITFLAKNDNLLQNLISEVPTLILKSHLQPFSVM